MSRFTSLSILSGGQTGADRAALDFAIDHAIPHGGWCPRGRLSESGPIPARYALRETPSSRYAVRTEWNVRDSDATVVFTLATRAVGGTALTLRCARALKKPTLHLARDAAGDPAHVLLAFLAEHEVRILNCAGPRASQEPEIGDFVRDVLSAAWRLGQSC